MSNLAPKGDIIFIILESEHTCSLFWRKTLALPFEAVHFTNMLGNSLEQKVVNVSLTRHEKKCEKSMGNSLPTWWQCVLKTRHTENR